MKVYGISTSGNCYKVRLMLGHLGEHYDWEEVPSTRVAPRTKEYLAKNPNGKVPLLELDDGQFLAESDAILYYLAHGTGYFPTDRLEQSRALQWMFFEQFSHEPYVAIARYIKVNLPADDPRQHELPALHENGNKALAVMEGHLSQNDYFAGGAYSIADMALFAYTHMAHLGGFDMSRYPAIGAWLDRVKSQPGFVGM